MICALIWNLRDIGNAAAIRQLCKLCHLHFVSFLVIIEPFIDSSYVHSICAKLGFSNPLYAASNKIWCFWINPLSVTLYSQVVQ